jgi:hypothetical protein
MTTSLPVKGRCRRVRPCAIALLAAALVGVASAATAQQQQELLLRVAPSAPLQQPQVAPSPQQQVPSPPPALPNPDYKPGFLDQLGRWVNDATGTVTSGLQGAGDKAKGAAAAASDVANGAASTISKLPATGIITGHEPCALAANGAPDCRPATEAVCRSKGLTSGRSLDIQTAEDCPVRVLLSGRPAAPGECKTVTYVTRALCQ